MLCYKVSNSINIVDCVTMETSEIDSIGYWGHQFKGIFDRSQLTQYIVINIDRVDFDVNTSRAAYRNKFKLVEVEVQRVDDIGKNE